MRARCIWPVVFLFAAAAVDLPVEAQEAGPRTLAEEILGELIGYRTSADYPEQTRAAANAAAERLAAAGFPRVDLHVVGPPGADAASLVARYRGSGGGEPILLMAHIDVVDADPAGWSFPPFEFGKDEHWYYGRGTTDNKAGAATLIANFIRLKREGWVPTRDFIAVLSGDEETLGEHIDWLVNERRDLVGAAFALNTDAGGGLYDDQGEPVAFYVQTAEKMYQSFRLTATNPGGHSSVPREDNAIYDLARALVRISDHRFPLQLNETTRAALAHTGERTPGDVGAAMRDAATGDLAAARQVAASSAAWNATLRTTCVATRLDAGVADNALPRKATATVNCRIFPGVGADAVEAALRDVVANGAIAFERVEESLASPPSPLSPEIVTPIEEVVAALWPGTPVVPDMSTGATDGLFVRNAGIPVYGISAIFASGDDSRAHGLDERVGIEEFHRAVEYWYRLIRRLGS